MTTPAPDTDAILEFLFRLGQAQLACGEQTAQVELLLRRIASAYGMRRSRVVVFPTAVFVSLHDGTQERVTLAEGPTHRLRLDQIADVHALTQSAESADISARQGIERLSEILKKRARFGSAGSVVGHAILTLGLAMVLKPSLFNLLAAVVLGAIVGLLKLVNQNRPVLAVPTPVLAAALVSALVFLALKHGLPVDPTYVLVPPLVTFLPGAMLSLGMVELAYGDMVSGSSRLITGFVQLVLLAFGFAAGALLVGYAPNDLIEAAAKTEAFAWGSWGPWAAVFVFGLGVYVHFSAPQNSLWWVLLVVLAAFAAQRLATALLNSEVSGFFGMLVATPLGYLIQTKFRGPPAMVTFLPAFWLVVPGSLGLTSVTQLLSDRAAGIDGLVTVVFAITSIALGTLVGASLYKAVTEHFGWWRLQIGRVGSYVRRADRR
ncbi:MAG: threonine/serine exporter family protein [Burkholderiales bacterium]|nr:threonine/serine exporter family protein [Burkholderiales bacterium]